MIYSDIFLGDSNLPFLRLLFITDIYADELLLTVELTKHKIAGRRPLYGGFAECFPNRIVVQTSRFTVDLNRSPQKAVYEKPEDAWDLPVRNLPLSEKLKTLLLSSYANWYKITRYQIERLMQFHSQIIILDLHSYNHRRGGANANPDPQDNNPDIFLGRNNL